MKTRTRDTLAAGGMTIAGYLGVLLVVLGVAGIAAFAWWLSVASSGVRGAGNVQKDQNSSSNREHWSATFNAEYQQLLAARDNLATLRVAANGPGATQQDRIDYQGALLNCRQNAAKYNADATSLLGRPWVPDGLPASINASDYCGK